jgi:hypothetical protein
VDIDEEVAIRSDRGVSAAYGFDVLRWRQQEVAAAAGLDIVCVVFDWRGGGG